MVFSSAERAALSRARPHLFLKPTSGWPVHDEAHALLAVQYMIRGFGNRSEYPMLIRRLAEIWPPGNPEAARVWAKYRTYKSSIEEKCGCQMPDISELRVRAVANYASRY